MTSIGNKQIFADNLAYYMKNKNIDRNRLCEDLGFKYSTVSEWLSANKYPRIDSIEKMANYFGIAKSQLIEKKEPSNISDKLSEREESLITNYRQLNTEGKDKTDEYVEDLIKTGKYSDDDDENVEIVTIAARKGGGKLPLKKRGNKSIFDAPDYR